MENKKNSKGKYKRWLADSNQNMPKSTYYRRKSAASLRKDVPESNHEALTESSFNGVNND